MSFTTKSYETDVLILGSGISGCGAAIAAKKEGVDVLLVDKGVLESSGNIGGGNDHFMAVLNEAEHDTFEDMRKYYVTPTSGITDTIAYNFYKAMRPCLEVLEESGIELLRNPDGTYVRSAGFGQPGPWWIHINKGYTVKSKIAKYIKNLGIRVVNNFFVTKLLKDGDRIAGCVGFDVLKGDFITVRCKTAVIAFGLSAQRVSTNSTRKPFNCWYSPYVTGSQIILPLEAGAAVLNLDIADKGTLLPKGYGAPGMNGINNMGGHELNAKGERFMGKYDPNWENCRRRDQIMGTFQEALEGSGPPFYMDMRHFSKEDARHLQYDLMPGDKETYLDYCRARNIDFTKEPLEVEIGERMIGGIIKCDDEQETPIKNLYAASLLATFSCCMGIGWTAGEHAAKRAKTVDMPNLQEKDFEKMHNEIFAHFKETKSENAVTYTEFEDAIRQVMDYYVGFNRTEKGMLQALKSMQTIEEYIPRLEAATLRELMRIRESLELFKLVRIYIQACLQRKESGRAMYNRTDYPNLDPAYNKCLITSLDESGVPHFDWTK